MGSLLNLAAHECLLEVLCTPSHAKHYFVNNYIYTGHFTALNIDKTGPTLQQLILISPKRWSICMSLRTFVLKSKACQEILDVVLLSAYNMFESVRKF